MAYQFGKRSYQRMQGINPILIECAENTIAQSSYDLTIPWMGGVRTPQQQNNIFREGNSRCDGFQTLSYHQIEAADNGYGNALDIIPTGKDPYQQHRQLNYIARLMLINWQELVYQYALQGQDIGIMIWGGTFGKTGWDKPHFEIRL